MNRRSLLKRGVLGGMLLTTGAGLGLLALPSRLPAQPRGPLRALDAHTFGVLAAVAARTVVAPGADPVAIAHGVDEALSYLPVEAQADFRNLLKLLESALSGALLDRRFSTFSAASAAEQDRTLLAWRDSRIALRRAGYHALRKLTLGAHYASPATWSSVGYGGPPKVPA